MTVGQLFHDVISGDWTGAEKRVKDWWNGAPQWLKDFVTKSESQEAVILQGLIKDVLPELVKYGLTTAGFVETAKDILQSLMVQNINTFTLQDIFANLNAAASPLVSAAATAPVAATPAAS